MTENEKVSLVKALVDDDPEATTSRVSVYLSVAKGNVIGRLYPYGIPEDVYECPPQYEMVQCQLAARYFLRRGAQGEISHSENGIARTYGSVDDADLLADITPYAKVRG